VSAGKGSGDYGRTETFSNDLITKTRMICRWAIIRVLHYPDSYTSLSSAYIGAVATLARSFSDTFTV
jgi:hypothetical protein